MIVLLSFSVFWMDRSSPGDRLSVSFIGILTGVAYLLVTGEQLPRISYFTLVHGFLNLSFLTMCATVVITLVVGALDKRGKSEIGDRVDRRCRWGFPLAYFGLLLVMIGVAFLRV
jgi:Na+/H+-dicarboxylate symporter